MDLHLAAAIGVVVGTLATVLVVAMRRLVAWVIRARELWEAVRELPAQQQAARDVEAELQSLKEATAEMRRLLEAQLREAQESGRKPAAAEALVGLARVELQRGRPTEAVPVLIEASKLYRETGDQRGYATCLGLLGTAYGDLGQFDAALASYQPALDVLQQIGDLAALARVQSNAAVAHDRRGNMAEAHALLGAALANYESVGDAMGQADTLLRLNGLQERTGRRDEAERSLARAKELLHSIGIDLRTRPVR